MAPYVLSEAMIRDTHTDVMPREVTDIEAIGFGPSHNQEDD